MNDELYLAQQPLSLAANHISEVLERTGAAGYGGIRVNVEMHRVELYWKGAVPQAILEVVDKERAFVAVDVHAAEFSRDELDVAASEIPLESAVVGIGRAYDGGGLNVYVDTPDAALRSTLLQNPYVAEVKPGGKGTPAVTRQNDASPYKAGGRMYNSDGGGCTTGFAMTVSQGDRILTSEHCSVPGSNQYYDGANDLLGASTISRADHDLMLIDPQGSAFPYVFDGRWNNSVGYRKPVTGWVRNYVGEYLCFSGSYTGMICNLYVNDDDYETTLEGGCCRLHNLIKVDNRVNGGALSGGGDSGGPALGHADPGTYDQILARGIITGGIDGTEIECPGGGSRVCYEEMFYMPIGVARNIFDAEVELCTQTYCVVRP